MRAREIPKRQAIKLREHLGYSTNSPVDLEDICRKKDINLIFKPYGRDSFSGIVMKREKESFTLINSSKSLGHQNYTIAHEFYHLFYEKNFRQSICILSNIKEKEDKEREAELFAINFLVPDDIYVYLNKNLKDVDKITIEEIINLESIFRVSHNAMLIKLKEMGLISEVYLERIKSGIIKRVIAMGKDIKLYLPTKETKVISKYIPLAIKTYEEEKISIGKFEELLHNVGLSIIDYQSEETITEDI